MTHKRSWCLAGAVAVLLFTGTKAECAGPILGTRTTLFAERGTACGPTRLQLCSVSPRPSPSRRGDDLLFRTRRPEQRDFNRLQRLAGAIADHMEAGGLGALKVRLKLILE